MFSTELKEVTLHVHQGLEKRLIAKIRDITVIADYVQLLRMMYGFYAPLHYKLHEFIKHEQRHAGRILDDIRYFTGVVTESILVSTALPPIPSYPSALGVMYVTEGSTLGGLIIAKMITKKLGIPPDSGFSFFNAYGEETQARWEKFRALLNGPFSASEHSEMKESAIAAFSTFNEWISEYESATHQ